MQNKNSELATKGDINEIKQGMKDLRQDIKEMGIFMRDGFKALDKKTDIIEKKLDRVITWSKERAREVLTW